MPGWRASLHLFTLLFEGSSIEPIYLSEQVTPLFRARRKRFPSARCSECIDASMRSGDSVFCYQEFGWDLLDEMRQAGFSRAEVITTWAPDLGYLGSFQPFFAAWR